jgi:protein-L-isoaspartate(D-aspartate) O-methyltransferase
MSSWFIPFAGASSSKGCTLAPTLATARRIRSLHLTRAHAPKESAIAIYPSVWFSSAEVRG